MSSRKRQSQVQNDSLTGTDTDLASQSSQSSGLGNSSNAARGEQLAPGQTKRNAADFDRDGDNTQHGDVGAYDATNTPDVSVPTQDVGERDVRPIHTETSKLVVSGTPAASDLYDEQASTGVCEGDWVPVTGILGSPESPSRFMDRDESTLFIEGMPSVSDIHQGQIGDCYFLAAVTSVAQSNPAHLRDMFTINGSNVQVRLYSHDPAANTWSERQISVDTQFLHSSDSTGAIDALLASGFRMGDTPVSSEWYVQATAGEMMWLMEDATYEFALWAPLLEKAYARLVERFGQYGGAHAGDANSQTHDDGSTKSGYEVIDGGNARLCFGMLYGDAEVNHDFTAIHTDATATDAELVEDNLDLITNLLMVNGTDVPADQAFFLSMSVSPSANVERLSDQIDHTLSLASVDRHENFKKTLEWIKALCATYVAEEAGGDDAKLEAAGNKLSDACDRFTAPAAWPILESDRDGGAYTDLRDLAQVAQNLGTDASDGRRLVYSSHAYPVLGSSLRAADGSALALDTSTLQTRYAEIDADVSTVQFRNPHGTNEPDFDGAGAADGNDNGEFNMSLAQVIRVFEFSEQALVET